MPGPDLVGSPDLVAQVHTNLVRYNSWENVTSHSQGPHTLLRGRPPAKLAELDLDAQMEWVAPVSMHARDCSMQQIESWFGFAASLGDRPARLTLAVVNDDGTVVYYFVHDGVAKPRQN